MTGVDAVAAQVTEANDSPVGDNRMLIGATPAIFAEIYGDNTHIAIWKRSLSLVLINRVAKFVETNPTFRLSVAVTPGNAHETLSESMGSAVIPELCEDVAEIVDMFCMLFGLERAGVRLGVLHSAMCPKFHVDRIPCRLVTTYHGAATEWLPHEVVDRSKLGHGSEGKPDLESGLFGSASDIQQLGVGDVALLKGDLWEGSEGQGLVHRSPGAEHGHRRLFLTMDFIN